MKPSIGRNVTVLGVASNGATAHPAVITRVWGTGDTVEGPQAVNLTVFPDARAPESHTSVLLYDTRDEAQAQIDAAAKCDPPFTPVVAHWPTREGSTEPGA